MVRHDIEEKDYVWKQKRRLSGDKGKKKDRRRKIIDGIILQDYERRQEDEAAYNGAERRSGEDRRSGKDRRK